MSPRTPQKFEPAKRALATWLLLALLGAPAAASDYGRALFQWVDAEGTVRYTAFPEEVPRSQRGTLQLVEASGAADWSPATAPALPAVDAAPPNALAEVPTLGEAVALAGEIDVAIARLEANIARDKAMLEVLISDPEMAQSLEESADLAAITERLPREQADLQALMERRGR